MKKGNAVLVKRTEPGEKDDLSELSDLARSANYKIVDKVIQQRKEDSAFNIGSGKAREINNIIQRESADTAIFDNELGPYQVYNLGNTLGTEVKDRFKLILEIFGERAGSRKAQLQVELAELRWELPRADAKASLAKREEKPGFMGLGEYDEKRKSDIKDQISSIKDELESLSKRDQQWRRQRRDSGFELIALAGYTNAGKSTLLQRLATDIDSDQNTHPDIDNPAEAENQLFTTLGTTTRRMDVPGRNVLLSDTVGFIDDLPHWLVKSFKSTLDEIYLADLVLLIIDTSDPVEELRRKVITCHDTLWNRVEAPLVPVYNKSDLVDEAEVEYKLSELEYLTPDPVVISAKEGRNIEGLVRRIKDELPDWQEAKVKLEMSDEGMSTVSWLYDQAEVLDVEYLNDIIVEFKAPDKVISKAKERSKETSLVVD